MTDTYDDTPETAIRFGKQRASKTLSELRQSHAFKEGRKHFRFECEHRPQPDGSIGDPCHLCNEDIDYRLRSPHPYSWSLDHIIPAQERPELFLDKNNWAASHLDCNVRRGTSEPALDLGTPSEVW